MMMVMMMMVVGKDQCSQSMRPLVNKHKQVISLHRLIDPDASRLIILHFYSKCV